jgi:hypothetical protein
MVHCQNYCKYENFSIALFIVNTTYGMLVIFYEYIPHIILEDQVGVQPNELYPYMF